MKLLTSFKYKYFNICFVSKGCTLFRVQSFYKVIIKLISVTENIYLERLLLLEADED